MTHPHDQAPAPLMAEVVEMVTRLRSVPKVSLGEAWNTCADAADMLTALATENATLRDDMSRFEVLASKYSELIQRHIQKLDALRASETALATQLAERDAELARVTREAEIHRASAVDNYERWTAATARIVALTEALAETSQTLAWQVFGECRGFSENLLQPNEALALSRTALTTDKGATS